MKLNAPHDILTKGDPRLSAEDALLCSMMEQSYELLKVHPLNMERKKVRTSSSKFGMVLGSREQAETAGFL